MERQFLQVSAIAEGSEDDVMELMSDLKAQRRARAKGAYAKLANDDRHGPVRATARDLWPTAKRRGWTATQFHTALVDKGHKVPFDSARKLLTELRKTGTC